MDDGLRKMRREIFIDREQLEYYYPQDHLTMHDLLQEMGRNIVLRESSDACKRSRLWRLEEIDHMLKRNKGTKKVQSICLNIAQKFKAEWHPDCFLKMENLRLLDLSGVCLSRNLNVLPSSLKFLRWDFYALKSLPSIDQLCELESLELRSSKIERLWNGAPRLDKLRIINLAESGDLIETPDFSATPNLEKLFLDDCHNLVGVHESIGQLKKLVELSLEDCVNLVKLPSCLEMNNLEVLNLRGCKKLEKLPEFGKNMTSLYLLSGWGASITEIPLSIIHLINLKFLDLYECDKLKKVPELPPNLIIAATHCDLLEPKEAVAKYLSGSRVSKGPIHIFYDYYVPLGFPWRVGIPEWFEGEDHCRSRESSSSEEVLTITANIPCDRADANNGECWGIAVALIFGCRSYGNDKCFSVNWKFQDYCHTNKRTANKEINSAKYYFVHRVYVGYYPFKKEDCRPHPSGVGIQLHLTLSFPTNPAAKLGLFANWKIVNCRWRLTCQKHFDEGR